MQPSILQRLHRAHRGVWQDTLAPAADLVACVLGQASPIAQEMLRLADINASSAARQRRASARQLRDVRLHPCWCPVVLRGHICCAAAWPEDTDKLLQAQTLWRLGLHVHLGPCPPAVEASLICKGRHHITSWLQQPRWTACCSVDSPRSRSCAHVVPG